MAGLYERFTGSPMLAGSPEYSKRIVEQTAMATEPAYKQALRGMRQGMANRGVAGSGLEIAARGGLEGQRLGQLTQAGMSAATAGADLNEQNRRRLEERGWSLEDYAKMAEERKQAREAEAEAQNQNLWNQLIAQAAGGVGGALVKGVTGGF